MSTKDEAPKAPEPVKPKRVKISRSQQKLYANLLRDKQAAQANFAIADRSLSNFVLGALAAHGVEEFTSAMVEGDELVYYEVVPSASGDGGKA